MGSQEYLDVVQATQVVVVDGDEAHVLEAFALHAVVYDVTQAVEGRALGEFFFGFAYGSGHAEAEAAAAIDFDLHIF